MGIKIFEYNIMNHQILSKRNNATVGQAHNYFKSKIYSEPEIEIFNTFLT